MAGNKEGIFYLLSYLDTYIIKKISNINGIEYKNILARFPKGKNGITDFRKTVKEFGFKWFYDQYNASGEYEVFYRPIRD